MNYWAAFPYPVSGGKSFRMKQKNTIPAEIEIGINTQIKLNIEKNMPSEGVTVLVKEILSWLVRWTRTKRGPNNLYQCKKDRQKQKV